MIASIARNNLVANIPWLCTTFSAIIQGDWVVLCQGENLDWVYLVLEVIGASLLAYKFKMFMGVW
jgi:hypothetical protein